MLHDKLTSGDPALMDKDMDISNMVVVHISSGDLELMHKTIKDGIHGNMVHTTSGLVLTHNPIQGGIHTVRGVIMLNRMRELASKMRTALISKASVEET